jgi:hypothetical protein
MLRTGDRSSRTEMDIHGTEHICFDPWWIHQFVNRTDRFAIFCAVRKPDKRFANCLIYANHTHLKSLQFAGVDMVAGSNLPWIPHEATAEPLSSHRFLVFLLQGVTLNLVLSSWACKCRVYVCRNWDAKILQCSKVKVPENQGGFSSLAERLKVA